MLRYVPQFDEVSAAVVPDVDNFDEVAAFVADLMRAGVASGYDLPGDGTIRLRFHEKVGLRARRLRPGEVVVVNDHRVCVVAGDDFREAWKLHPDTEGLEGEVHVTTKLTGNLDT